MSNDPPRFATPHDALLEAIRRIGSQQKAARVCECSQPTVWRWVRDRKMCSHRYVLALSKASGVSPRDLRPDLYWPDHLIPPQGDAEPAAAAAPPGILPPLTTPPPPPMLRGVPINDNCCCGCCHRSPPSAA